MKLYKNSKVHILSNMERKSFAIEVACTHKYMKYKD